MTPSTAAPVDNLVRASFGPASAELRAQTDGGDGGTLFGHFAVFNQWTEISSMWEGNFVERIAPGALTDTIRTRGDQVKVLYDHGQDPQIGNKPLGAIRSLTEDKKGGYYEVDLLRGADGNLVPYNRDFIAPAARAGLLGASFRFKVTEETWNTSGETSDHNPKGLDERTITGMDLYEFGPVTFPAYEAATAGVRCGTDRFLDSLLNDPRFIARFTERLGAGAVDRILGDLTLVGGHGPELTKLRAGTQIIPNVRNTTAADGPDDTNPPDEDPAAGQSTEDTQQRRLDYFQRKTAGFERSLSRLKEAPQ
jgi:HK97 family phage prohead protease